MRVIKKIMKDEMCPFETNRLLKKLNMDSERQMTFAAIKKAIMELLDDDLENCILINFNRVDIGAVNGISQTIFKESLMRAMKNNSSNLHVLNIIKALTRHMIMD